MKNILLEIEKQFLSLLNKKISQKLYSMNIVINQINAKVTSSFDILSSQLLI